MFLKYYISKKRGYGAGVERITWIDRGKALRAGVWALLPGILPLDVRDWQIAAL